MLQNTQFPNSMQLALHGLQLINNDYITINRHVNLFHVFIRKVSNADGNSFSEATMINGANITNVNIKIYFVRCELSS